MVAVTVASASGAAAQGAQKNTGPQLVQDADNAARQPWAADAVIQLPPLAGGVSISNSVDFPVPADKRLVIEGYSGECDALEGIYFQGGADVYTNGAVTTHFLKWDSRPYVMSGSMHAHWAATGPVRIYADPGSNVRAWLKRGSLYPYTTTCQITFTGYFVDIP